MMRSDIVRLLPLAGIAAGLLFILVSSVESFARPGFDLKRHAISMLSLGDRGWLMVVTFILSGVLTLLCAVGLRAAEGGLWGPLLIAVYGLGLIIAGIFPAPASFGFPSGTPADMAPVMTTSAKLHGMGFMVAFSALIIACFVFARGYYDAGETELALISIAAGLAMPVLVASGMSNLIAPGIAFFIAAIVGWVWLGAVVVRVTP
ncbi:DUF998 domain-containing protein [Bradyrhizobium forestalis]|uniref:DUF998 domain-containing protein n=1 Tax=Bradyrhizobium forestalis TaxID=1419263 RepID=A0A2M8RCD9_9BRAD|nr:DUF998 domain-containing protein [Bradyrhizobium forestalis]PJG55469.1 DUF998 domain-containing protein [Bradyrhizobium forestalis]